MRSIRSLHLLPALAAALAYCSCAQPLDVDTPRNKIYEDSVETAPLPAVSIAAQLVSLSIAESSRQWNYTFLVPTAIAVDTSSAAPSLIIRALGCRGSSGSGSRLRELELRCDSIPLDGRATPLLGDPADMLAENAARFLLSVPGVPGTVDSDVTLFADAINTTSVVATIDRPSRTVLCSLSGAVLYNGIVVQVQGGMTVTY